MISAKTLNISQRAIGRQSRPRESPRGPKPPGASRQEGPLLVLQRIISQLPVIGLIANITTPGGIGKRPQELSFGEYCRLLADEGPQELARALEELPCDRQVALLCLWMACTGARAQRKEQFVRIARRIRAAGADLEVRFFCLALKE